MFESYINEDVNNNTHIENFMVVFLRYRRKSGANMPKNEVFRNTEKQSSNLAA